MRALFIGSYPNDVEPYRSVFFRQLIHGFADMGVECHVISCVSYTLYRGRSGDIPKFRTETTPSGATVKVYYPHIVTYSAKKIGSLAWALGDLTCYRDIDSICRDSPEKW